MTCLEQPGGGQRPRAGRGTLRAASALGRCSSLGLRNAALALAPWGQGAGCAGRRLRRNAARPSDSRAGLRATTAVSPSDAPHPYPAATVQPQQSPWVYAFLMVCVGEGGVGVALPLEPSRCHQIVEGLSPQNARISHWTVGWLPLSREAESVV